MEKIAPKTVDQYIDLFSDEEQVVLKKIRSIIKTTVPEAEERISYQMPAYKYHGWLVYFAAFKQHYSLFIPPSGVFEAFAKELAPYKHENATIQFQKSQPIPFDLITQLVSYAAKQNSTANIK